MIGCCFTGRTGTNDYAVKHHAKASLHQYTIDLTRLVNREPVLRSWALLLSSMVNSIDWLVLAIPLLSHAPSRFFLLGSWYSTKPTCFYFFPVFTMISAFFWMSSVWLSLKALSNNTLDIISLWSTAQWENRGSMMQTGTNYQVFQPSEKSCPEYCHKVHQNFTFTLKMSAFMFFWERTIKSEYHVFITIGKLALLNAPVSLRLLVLNSSDIFFFLS